MKKAVHLIILLFLFSSSAYAETTLQFHVVGIKGDIQKNAEGRLDAVKKQYPTPISTVDIQHVYEKGTDEVKKALQPFGYYKSRVTSGLSHQGSQWIATYKVTIGPALHITKLNVSVAGEGGDNKKIKHALSHLPIKPGDILQTSHYEKAKDDLFDACNNAGYIKAQFTKTEIYIDLKRYQSIVTIRLNTGRRYYFGKTTFSSSPYAQSFLHRFLSYKQGKPFSNQKLMELQQNMSSSYYFSQVDINPDLKNISGDEIPVNIKTSVPRSQKYNVGIGYGTFTGPRLSAGMSFRRLTDTGQHLDTNLRLSQVLSVISAKYYIPGANPITDRWLLGANYNKFEPKNGNSEATSLQFGYINKIKSFQMSTTLNYLRERYTVFNAPQRKSKLLYPNFTVNYIKANDLINPTHGYSLSLSLQGAYEKIFSTTSFAQADGKAKYIMSPFSFAKIIARGELGYTLVHDLYDLPLTLRFVAGGLTSVRGFEEASIGPGKYLEIGSLEYQNKLYGNLAGAVFYDIGVASNHFNDPINRSVGVGLVYNSIVGPVKIYLARAISKKDQPYGVEFSVGPEF